MTGSGKTTLAKRLIPEYRKAGTPAIILDPMRDPHWGITEQDFQTHEPEIFLTKMYQSRRCALFVDEGGESIGRYSREMGVVTTRSRHFGHKTHIITQRPSQIDRTVRDQCTELYLFRVGFQDAKTLAEEFGYQEIRDANNFEQGQFFKLSRFNPPILFNIFNSEKTP